MKGRTVRGASVGFVVVAAALGGFIAWRVLGGDEPSPVALISAAPSADDVSATPTDGFEGSWIVDTASGSLEDGTSTFAGYAIEEELTGFGTNTAVGRTQDVVGQLAIEGTTVTELQITVDMTTLRSDDERRDGQLAERGLETSAFPTATFTQTEPVDLGSEPEVGEPIDTTITGDLTLHGVTREVTVPIQAQWTGAHIEVAARLDVALTDHDIEPPVGFLVLSVADTGTVEMHVLFEKAGEQV
jgi:polyisoprenoid-binding protein YceI